MLKMYHFVIQN